LGFQQPSFDYGKMQTSGCETEEERWIRIKRLPPDEAEPDPEAEEARQKRYAVVVVRYKRQADAFILVACGLTILFVVIYSFVELAIGGACPDSQYSVCTSGMWLPDFSDCECVDSDTGHSMGPTTPTTQADLVSWLRHGWIPLLAGILLCVLSWIVGRERPLPNKSRLDVSISQTGPVG
jgi:hypothetical protein